MGYDLETLPEGEDMDTEARKKVMRKNARLVFYFSGKEDPEMGTVLY